MEVFLASLAIFTTSKKMMAKAMATARIISNSLELALFVVPSERHRCCYKPYQLHVLGTIIGNYLFS